MEMTYEQLLDEEIEFLQKHWDKLYKLQPSPTDWLNDVAIRLAHLIERRKSLKVLANDRKPDVLRRDLQGAERGEPAHSSAHARHDSADQVLPFGGKSPFEWMKAWLDAYDKEHTTALSKEILNWIYQQPMSAG